MSESQKANASIKVAQVEENSTSGKMSQAQKKSFLDRLRNFKRRLIRGWRNFKPYKKIRPSAKKIKVLLQMCIGFGLIVLLAIKFYSHVGHCFSQYICSLTTLEIVGRALAYSSGVELAYTLFTEGPDEAVEPIIMGLAAATLLSISRIDSQVNLLRAGEIAIYVLTLAGLFVVRKTFIESEKKKANKKPQNQERAE